MNDDDDDLGGEASDEIFARRGARLALGTPPRCRKKTRETAAETTAIILARLPTFVQAHGARARSDRARPVAMSPPPPPTKRRRSGGGERLTLPADLAAELGVEWVYEDELEARLAIAAEARSVDALLSRDLRDVFVSGVLARLDAADLASFSLASRGCRALADETRARDAAPPDRASHHEAFLFVVADFAISPARMKLAAALGCPVRDPRTCALVLRGVFERAPRAFPVDVLEWALGACGNDAWMAAVSRPGIERRPWLWDAAEEEDAMLGSDDDEYFRIEDVKFLTRVAARVGNLGLVRRLFDAFRLSRRHEETFAGAAEGGHVFIIEHLLTERDAFIPVDRVFELAAGRGRVELLRFLLDNGMRPETPRSRARCARAAADAGEIDCVEWLFANGFEMDEATKDTMRAIGNSIAQTGRPPLAPDDIEDIAHRRHEAWLAEGRPIPIRSGGGGAPANAQPWRDERGPRGWQLSSGEGGVARDIDDYDFGLDFETTKDVVVDEGPPAGFEAPPEPFSDVDSDSDGDDPEFPPGFEPKAAVESGGGPLDPRLLRPKKGCSASGPLDVEPAPADAGGARSDRREAVEDMTDDQVLAYLRSLQE